MSTVVPFADAAIRRERFLIALADCVDELLHADAEDPAPVSDDLRRLAAELQDASAAIVREHYLFAVARFITPLGADIVPVADPEPRHHRACAAWARGYLERIGDDFGVPLLRECRP